MSCRNRTVSSLGSCRSVAGVVLRLGWGVATLYKLHIQPWHGSGDWRRRRPTLHQTVLEPEWSWLLWRRVDGYQSIVGQREATWTRHSTMHQPLRQGSFGRNDSFVAIFNSPPSWGPIPTELFHDLGLDPANWDPASGRDLRWCPSIVWMNYVRRPRGGWWG